MRRWVFNSVGLGVGVMVLAAAPLAGATSTGAGGATPPAAVRGLTCHSDRIPTARWASVTATMGSVPQTQQMQLKFDLWEAQSGSPATKTQGKNLGVWLSPKNPSLGRRPADVWNFTKYVFGLDAPASYQFRVSFRWLGSDGKVLSTAQRSTKRCPEHQLSPDVMVVSPIEVTPTLGHPNEDTYTAVIRNRGGSAAGPFKVGFVVPGASTEPTVTIQQLRAGKQHTVSFVGPLCSASGAPEIVADTSGQVPDDYKPANNSLFATCPSSNAS